MCGGTAIRRLTGPFCWGLSPRVRGNRGSLILHALWERSIPACAEEPANIR